MLVAEYDEMVKSQNERCLACGRSSNGRLVIDHYHGCCPKGRSCERCRRGLLDECNLVLGVAGDDPEVALYAGIYLARWFATMADDSELVRTIDRLRAYVTDGLADRIRTARATAVQRFAEPFERRRLPRQRGRGPQRDPT